MRVLLIAAAFAFLSAQPGGVPPIPPLPASGWPAPSDAEPFARALLARVPPAELARVLAAQPELEPAILRNLGTAIVGVDGEKVAAYLAEVTRAAAATFETRRLTAIAVVDPLRYGTDAAFRARIDAHLPATLAKLPPAAARAVMGELTASAALDFDTAEAAAAAAHLIPHTSRERRVAFDRALRLPDDGSSAIEASIFSLNTSSFTPAEALSFVEAVHSAAPKRRIIVLGDAPMRAALAQHKERLHLDLVDDLDRVFSPWPRDPFIVGRSAKGIVFVNRPNLQPHREEDQNMVRALVDSLPAARWTVAPVPFHNGHILRTPAAVWISIHSVEPRALALLGLDHVPVETFGTRAGVERYTDAVKRAARELGDFFHAPVRFVHAMPSEPEEIARLAGGAGYDLDSIVTLLPRSGGKTDALVADVSLGAAAARKATAGEWNALRSAYGFSESAAAIADSQSAALQQFLDEIAAELRRDGMTVRRVPLLKMPGDAFVLTVNNVVLEPRRAEGFATLLPSMDRAARDAFTASGYRLDIFPPLARSVV
ncbi:MAG TPA: hypothetical protein VG323_10640, partial [Thermoanaerobaculia bacterium]|nr:hypothetical protein [Thermoanaerobaculia bacterium]